jgi:DNA-binding transcriptional LysR family regulator
MREIELRQLRTFLILAEELHFGRTATRVGVSPSRVSQSLRALERAVGGTLVQRTSRHVELTALGRHLRDRVRPAYSQLLAAVASTRELTAPSLTGRLRVGMYSACNSGPHFVDIAKEFSARHPECTVEVVNTGFDRDQLDWLRTGEVDMLAIRLPLHDPGVTIGPVLSDEPRVLAVAVDHPLAQRTSVSIEDVADYAVSDYPSLPPELINAFIPPRTPSGKLLRRRSSGSIAESPVRVALGEIVHPTVPSFLDHYPHPRVTSVPIDDLPPSRTALVWLNDVDDVARSNFVAAADDVLAAVLEHPSGGGR